MELEGDDDHEQPDLPGLFEREQALSRLELAHGEWIDDALTCIHYLATRHREFTTDDVWDIVIGDCIEPRAMGAAMRKAKTKGWILATNRVRSSNRAVCHRRPVRVWQSRLGGVIE